MMRKLAMREDDPLFDYKLYRYGRSRQVFRGPVPDLRGGYVAFLGGSGTFGRFTDCPYPDLLGTALGRAALNLGTEGAGPGFFLADPEVARAASDSAVCVVQAMCASAISNRMFTIRPRRNSRLHAVSDLLAGIFPEVDFTRFAYVPAMLKHLHAVDDHRFRLVANEMRNAWIGRTQTLLATLEARTILFWFSQRVPEEGSMDFADHANYPQFVDRAMLDAVRTAADGYAECISIAGLPQDLTIEGETVLYRPSGDPIDENREFPSPEMHAAAAEALRPEILRLLGV